MAVVAFKGSLDASLNATAGVAAVPTAADTTAVVADIATLVADGALPTQAHVTALAGHWATLLASINLVNAAAVPSSNAIVNIDLASIATINKLHKVFAEIEKAAVGSGLLTQG